MHELTIALSLIETVCDELPALGNGARVAVLHVRLGPLSSVVPEALALSFDLAASGSALPGARLEIERSPLVIWCDRCVAERTAPSVLRLACPVCGSTGSTVVAGRELELAAVEVVGAARF